MHIQYLLLVKLISKIAARVLSDNQVNHYLQHYGYCQTSAGSSCLENFQNAAHLSTHNGQITEQTEKLIRSRRCGVTDENLSGSLAARFSAFQSKAGFTSSISNKTPTSSFRRNKRSLNFGESLMLDKFTAQEISEEILKNPENLDLSRWDKQILTYYITNNPTKIPSPLVRQVFKKATQIWSQYSGIKFRESKRSDIADITFSFKYRLHEDGFSNAFDGPGGALAHAFFPTKGEAHFDVEEKWTSGLSRISVQPGRNFQSYRLSNNRYKRSTLGRDRASLLAVAAHEMGHILGLPHSPIRGSLMSPYYDDYRKNSNLAYDDIQAIEYLYGKNKNQSQLDKEFELLHKKIVEKIDRQNIQPISPVIRYVGDNEQTARARRISPVSRFMTPKLNKKQPYQTKDRCIRRDIHDIDVDAETGNLRILKNLNYYVWSNRNGYILKKRIARTWEGTNGYINAIVTSKLRRLSSLFFS